MHNRILYAMLRVAALLLPAVPLAVAYFLADVFGSAAFLVFPGPRRRLLANLTVAFPEISANRRRAIGVEAFRHDAKNWVDTLRIPELPPDSLKKLIQVEGWHYLEEALLAGNGALLVSLHLGNFDLVGQVLTTRGIALTVPVEHIRPEALHRFLTERRESNGIRLLPIEHASRGLLQTLRRGEIVGITADRRLGGKGVTVDFFGRPAVLPRGPAALARRAGAPVLVGIGLRENHGKYHGFIVPVPMPLSDDANSFEKLLTESIAAIFERFIRRAPGQWLAFFGIWESDAGPSPAATMRQVTGAAV